MNADFVHFFSFAAGEFFDEAWSHILDEIASQEGKTVPQVVKEIEGKWEERKVEGEQHPFQIWGSRSLLKKIKAATEWEKFDRDVFKKLSDADILAYLEKNLISCTFFRGHQGYSLRKGTDDLRAAVAQEMFDDRKRQ